MVRQAGVAPGAASRDVENAAWTAFGMPRSDLTAQRSPASVFQDWQDLTGSDIPEVDGCVGILHELVVIGIVAAYTQHFLVVVPHFLRHIVLLKVPPGAPTRRAVFPAASLARTVRGCPHGPPAGVEPATRKWMKPGSNGLAAYCPAEFHRASGTANHQRYRGAASYGLRLIF